MARTVDGVRIRIDDRERALIEAARRRSADDPTVAVAVERLPMGDVILEPGGGGGSPYRVIVERKILTDLVASVFDGRLAEQHRRLADYHAAADPRAGVWTVLLVEGALAADTFHRAANPEGRSRLCVGTQLRLALQSRPADRRLFLRSSSEAETVEMCVALARAIAADPPPPPPIGTDDDGYPHPPPPPPRSLPGRVRGPVFVQQLAATAGVSCARAARVADRYGTLHRLVSAVAADPEAAHGVLVDFLGGRTVAGRLLADLGMGEFVPVPAKKGARKKKDRAEEERAAAAAGPRSRRCRRRLVFPSDDNNNNDPSSDPPGQNDVGQNEGAGQLVQGGLVPTAGHVPEEERRADGRDG